MALTEHQKNIVNPFAELRYRSHALQIEGIGASYDFDNSRNKFVLDGIHEKFLYFGELQQQETVLNPDVALGDDNTVLKRDLIAYISLYVQNAKYDEDSESLVLLSDEQIQEELEYLVQTLEDTSPIALSAYSTKTSRSAALPENQEGMRKKTANLMAIPQVHSQIYRDRLYASFGLDPTLAIGLLDNIDAQMDLAGISSGVNVFYNTDPTVDLFEWVNNCEAGMQTERVYFNTLENNFYYTVRTEFNEESYLDLGELVLQTEGAPGRFDAIAAKGISEILKYTNKDSGNNRQLVFNTLRPSRNDGGAAPLYLQVNRDEDAPPALRAYDLKTYKDPRPGSRWVCAVTISKQIIDSLSGEGSVGFQEYELTPLQKAKVIINPTKSNVIDRDPRIFTPLRLLRNTVAVSRLMDEYYETLISEDIYPESIGGLDLSVESERVSSFVDSLGNFYTYNNIAIEDGDQVQIYLDINHNLLYICINGFMYSHASGNRNLATLDPLPNPEENVREFLLSAFSFQTSNTFSYIYHSDEIAKSYFDTTPNSREPWMDFLEKYNFPTFEITPEEIAEIKSGSNKYSLGTVYNMGFESLRAAKQIWNTAEAEASKERSLTPEEAQKRARQSKKFINVKKGFQTANCSTTAARITKSVLNLKDIFGGKVSTRVKVRQVINTLKYEIMAQESLRQEVGPYIPYVDAGLRLEEAQGERGNFAAARQLNREIERLIDQQIFCGLDVFGSIIEDQILDPIEESMSGAETGKYSQKPSESPPIVLKFHKIKSSNVYAKQSEIWTKIIQRLISHFIKSMLTALARDLINAILGCGPESNTDNLTDLTRSFNYGIGDLREMVEQASLPLPQLAARAGIFKTTVEMVNGEQVITKVPYDYDRLLELVDGIGQMTTPEEQHALLLGDGENSLYQHIAEVMTDPRDVVRWPIGFEPLPEDESQREFQEAGEALDRIVSRRYLSFGSEREEASLHSVKMEYYIFTTFSGLRSVEHLPDKIREFLILLGQALNLTPGETFEDSPLALYCENLDPNYNALTFRFSVDQIAAQQSMIVSEKIAKINSYCDFLRQLDLLEMQLNNFIRNLPVIKAYEDLLKLIAALSRGFQAWIAEYFADRIKQEPPFAITQVQNLYSTKMGSELFFQSYDFLRHAIPVSYVSSPTELPDIQINPGSNYVYWTMPTRWGGSGTNLGGNSEVLAQTLGCVNGLTNRLPLPFEEPGKTDEDGKRIVATHNGRMGSYGARVAPLHIKNDIEKDYRDPLRNPEGLNLSHQELLTQKAVYNEDVGREVIDRAIRAKEYNAPYSGYIPRIFMRINNVSDQSIPVPYKGVHIVKGYQENPNNNTSFLPNFTSGIKGNVLAQYLPTETRESTEIGTENYEYPISYFSLYSNESGFGSLSADGDYTFFGVKFPSLTETDIRYDSPNYANGYRDDTSIIGLVNPYMFGFDKTLDDIRESGESPESIGRYERNTNSYTVGNFTVKVDQSLNRSYSTSQGVRRTPKYLAATNISPFVGNPEECNDAAMLFTARSWITCVQARIQEFLINVYPLTTVYPLWGSTGTVELVCSYLNRKIKNDLQKKGLLTKLYTKFDIVEKIYAGYPADNPQLVLTSNQTPEEKFDTTIKAMYRKMLENIGRTTEFSTIHRGIFEDWDFDEHLRNNKHLSRYKGMLTQFYSYLLEYDGPARFSLTAEELNAFQLFIRNSLLSEETGEVTDLGLHVGQYYFPVAFLIAQALIFYDYSVKSANRYSDTNYKLQYEMASADDAYLSALVGQTVDTFSVKYQGFPIGVIYWDQSLYQTYYNSDEVVARIEILEQEMENFAAELTTRQLLYTPQQLVEGAQNQNFREMFSDSEYFVSTGLQYSTSLRRFVQNLRPTEFANEEAEQVYDGSRGQDGLDSVAQRLEEWFSNTFNQVYLEPALNNGNDEAALDIIRSSIDEYIDGIPNTRQSYVRQSRDAWISFVRNGYLTAVPTVRDASTEYTDLLYQVFAPLADAEFGAGQLIIPEGSDEEILQQEISQARQSIQRSFFSFLALQYIYSQRYQGDILNELGILRSLTQ